MASFDQIVNFTLTKEGGLSRDPDDNAAKYPSPYLYKGHNDWHTNKGFTYKTFETGSKNIGIDNNYNNFIVMPRNVWYKLAKTLFWDKLHLDELKSQSIANLLFSWFWGSGYNWRKYLIEIFKSYNITWDKNDFKGLVKNLNKLIGKYGSKTIYKAIERKYRLYLISLNQSKFIKGWLKRLDELFELNSNDLITFAKTNKLLIGSILIGTALLLGNGRTAKI